MAPRLRPITISQAKHLIQVAQSLNKHLNRRVFNEAYLRGKTDAITGAAFGTSWRRAYYHYAECRGYYLGFRIWRKQYEP